MPSFTSADVETTSELLTAEKMDRNDQLSAFSNDPNVSLHDDSYYLSTYFDTFYNNRETDSTWTMMKFEHSSLKWWNPFQK